MKVKINHTIKEPECSLYDPEGNCLGIINTSVILNDVRLQIKRQKLEGYYILFENHRIDICSNGRMNSWPTGFFDLEINQLAQL